MSPRSSGQLGPQTKLESVCLICLSLPPVTLLSYSLFGGSWGAVKIDLSSFDWPGSHYIDQPGLEPAAILLPWPLGCWDLDEKAQRVKGTCH